MSTEPVPGTQVEADPAAEFDDLEVDAPLVGIVMGSKSDMPLMEKAAQELEERGIRHEMRVMSAHRDPETVADYAATVDRLRTAGVALHELEIPHGPCASFQAAGGQRVDGHVGPHHQQPVITLRRRELQVRVLLRLHATSHGDADRKRQRNTQMTHIEPPRSANRGRSPMVPTAAPSLNGR